MDGDFIGTRLGKYEIQAEIGRGGMGAVYMGYDPMLDRSVAVKILAPHLVWEKEFVERFLREARAAARLKHPNVVIIHDVGQDGDRYYFVMEYLEGQTLTDLIQQRGPMAVDEVLRILRPLADALDYAHQRGLVHRDVKPGNVIVGPAGGVTLTDFGIVRAAQETRLTATGTVVGTPEYMSPEQAKGLAVGACCDQYSLAVVAYEMLTGRVPFEAESTLALLHKIAYDPPPPLRQARPDLPVEVEEVLVKALAKEPGDRYGTASAFVDALGQAWEGTAIEGAVLQAQVTAAPDVSTKVLEPAAVPAPATSPPVEPVMLAAAPAPLPAAAAKPAPTQRRVPGWAWALVVLVVFGGIVALLIANWGSVEQLLGGGTKPASVAGAFTDTPALTETKAAAAVGEPTETPLPAPSSWGSEENPIVWSFVPSGEMERVAGGAQAVAHLLHEETGLFFETNVATEYAGVIEAMCSDPPEAHMGSLATFAYVLAADRGCAEAELVSVRFESPTYNGQIIVRADSGLNSIADLADRTFCRPDPLSASGWIIPSLTLRAAGVNPEADLAEIVDAGSHDAVVAAVYNGDCDAGATYVDARTGIEEDYPDVMDVVTVIEFTVDIPNDGVQFVPSVPQGLRTKIVEGLLVIADTEPGQEALDTAYQWAGLERHDDTFYDPFRQVLQAAGVSVEELADWPGPR
jgi:phosphate/phosphite/phosphonate ABC transporter binding protein